MRRYVLSVAFVAAAMSQSCCRHTSESAQSAASLRSTSVERIAVADSLRVTSECFLLIDSPTVQIVRSNSSCNQSITLSGRRAVIASRTEAFANAHTEIETADSVAADTMQTKTEVRESRRQRWWMPLLALVVAAFMLRLSLRGIGSRR